MTVNRGASSPIAIAIGKKIRKTVITLAATCAVVVVERVRLQKFSNTSKRGIEKESLWVKNPKIRVKKVFVAGLVI